MDAHGADRGQTLPDLTLHLYLFLILLVYFILTIFSPPFIFTIAVQEATVHGEDRELGPRVRHGNCYKSFSF